MATYLHYNERKNIADLILAEKLVPDDDIYTDTIFPMLPRLARMAGFDTEHLETRDDDALEVAYIAGTALDDAKGVLREELEDMKAYDDDDLQALATWLKAGVQYYSGWGLKRCAKKIQSKLDRVRNEMEKRAA